VARYGNDRATQAIVIAQRDGVVDYTDSERIIVKATITTSTARFRAK
jgi:hypothetical protein